MSNENLEDTKWFYIDTKTIQDLSYNMGKLNNTISEFRKEMKEMKNEIEYLKDYIVDNRDIHNRNDKNIVEIKNLIFENRITHQNNNDTIHEIKDLLDKKQILYTDILKKIGSEKDFEKVKPILDKVPFAIPRIKNIIWRKHDQPVNINKFFNY